MAQVYAGSVCTLAALSSKDSNGGLFTDREKVTEFPYRFELTLGSHRIHVFPCEHNDWLDDMHCPLLDRAWTLQERELSSRILHFSQDTLLWEFKTSKASIDLPWLHYRAYDRDPPPKFMYDSAEEASGQYCQNLTYAKDKLIALSGIAHDHQEKRVGDKYAAGLWESDMPSALLWRTLDLPYQNYPCQRPSNYRAPSWSWASVDGHVLYDSQMLKDVRSSSRLAAEYDFGAFHVNQVQTTTNPTDTMGAVSAGFICLTGLVRSVIVDAKTSIVGSTESTYTCLHDHEGSAVWALLADDQAEVQPNQKIYCISVRDEQYWAQIEWPKDLYSRRRQRTREDEEEWVGSMVMGLGLTAVEAEEKKFRRLGLVRWMKKTLFEGIGTSTIKVL
ncbi:MAG: hypothetical protein Q9181_000350 [Wetmoreana brouardii]